MFNKIMFLIRRLHKLRCRLGTSEKWLNYLREQGMRIGNGTVIHSKPFRVQIDQTRPWLVEIGKNVQITEGVKILTHGYDWSTVKAVTGEILGSAGKVTIGDNCFIGMNAIILKNTTVGDNVIIGAGSVLTGGTFESNTVVAGNPARVICSLDDYIEKRRLKQLDEAKELVTEYIAVYGKPPEKAVLSEFFWLFEKRGEITESSFKSQMRTMNNYDFSFEKFMQTKPMFNSYDEFINYCMNNN